MLPQLYESFQRWSDGGTVWLYSDPHFDDADCKAINAEWPSPEEQIAKINKKVHKGDTLIILGDIGDPTPLKQIKGYKVLICGNHDRGASYYEEYFNEVYIGPLFISDRILLSHEPINLPFALNIHGHDHSNSEQVAPHHLNLCAEHIDYIPISFKSIIKFGFLRDIPSIHRITIDNAIIRKEKRENENN